MSVFLEDERIVLRALTLSDVSDEYVAWLNDAEVTKGMETGRFPTSKERLTDFVARIIHDQNVVMLAICEKVGGKHIGNIKLDRFDFISGTAELGIMLGDKNYWGRGIAKDACRLLIGYAFKTLGLRKVSLTVYSNNPSAQAVYEALGFSIEGRLKAHVFVQGAYHDKLWMSIFNSTNP